VTTDPETLEEYQEACKENLTATGEGADRVTWFPCPGCTVAGWKGMPATAGLDDPVLSEPSTCLKCDRTFRFEIKRTEKGVEGCVVHLGGPPMPPYLPEVIQIL
jgi:hypothetical protein